MSAAASAIPKILSAKYGPPAVVFVASGCLMVLEIVAGRLISGFLGASLYTWTAVIGVVLAGIAAGNHLGGLLSDRFGAERLIGGLLLLGAATCLAILGLSSLVQTNELFAGTTWPVRIGLSVAFIFFLPSCALGTISPAVMTATLLHRERPGRIVGLLQAAGASGSVAGTFLAGFVLTGLFGTTAIIWGVAAVLAFLSLLFVVKRSAQLAGAAIAGIGVAASISTAQGDGWVIAEVGGVEQRIEYEKDSDYFRILVTPAKRFDPSSDLAEAHPDASVLMLDAMVHGMAVPSHPETLIYTYERITERMTREIAKDRPELSVMFIGGGAYTFPRYVEAAYPPNTVIDVVEIDPAVTEAVHEALGLPRSTRIRTFNQDARVFVKQSRRKYDIIYGDAFSGLSIPYHLTTVEFIRELDAILEPNGAYILNIVDSPSSQRLLGAVARTLREVFPNVEIYTVTGAHERQTFVLFASRPSRRLPAIASEVKGARQLADADLNGPILTDDFAPVDQLIAPIYAHRTEH